MLDLPRPIASIHLRQRSTAPTGHPVLSTVHAHGNPQASLLN
ncbi:MAG: hypothetical protein R3E68_07105 [Burkholderiaceae bacterium]